MITDVVYFYELSQERRGEAEACARKFGFTPHFCHDDPFSTDDIHGDIARTINCNDRLWVPTINDLHPDHKRVNKIGRRYAQNVKCELMFYTIDMNCFQEPLREMTRLDKKSALLDLFPSQAALFENEKYFLFEGYSENEFKIDRHFPATMASPRAVTIAGYNPPETLECLTDDCEQDEAYLNRLIIKYYNVKSVDYIGVHNGNRTIEYYA